MHWVREVDDDLINILNIWFLFSLKETWNFLPFWNKSSLLTKKTDKSILIPLYNNKMWRIPTGVFVVWMCKTLSVTNIPLPHQLSKEVPGLSVNNFPLQVGSTSSHDQHSFYSINLYFSNVGALIGICKYPIHCRSPRCSLSPPPSLLCSPCSRQPRWGREECMTARLQRWRRNRPWCFTPTPAS